MKRSSHNFGPRTLKKLFPCILCASFILPSSALGVSKRALNYFMTIIPFVHLAKTIERINYAMKIASENPLDQNRREIVRQAISAMPAALIGMAGEFKKGNLHNGDLQNVLSVFGSFVDVNAAANMTQFLKNPDPNLIPKLGADFPKDILGEAKESRRLVFNSKAPKPTQISPMPTSPTTAAPASERVDAAKGNEIVDLSAVTMDAAPLKDLTPGKATSRRIVLNMNADKNAANNAPNEATNAGSTDSRILKDASKELTRIEDQRMFRTTLTVGAAEEKPKEDTFFKTPKKQIKKIARKKGKARWRAIERPKVWPKSRPKSWNSSSVFQILWDWVIPSAYGDDKKCEVEGCPGGSGSEGSSKFEGLSQMFSMMAGPLTAGIASMAQMQANKDSERAETERVRIQNQAAQERAQSAAQVQQQSLAVGMLSTQAALQAQRENTQLMAQAKERSDQLATETAQKKLDFDKYRYDQDREDRRFITHEQVALARRQFEAADSAAKELRAAESARNYFAMNSQGPGLVTTRTGTTTTQVGLQGTTSVTSPPLSGATPSVTGQTASRTPASRASVNTARTPVTSRASLALLDALTQRRSSGLGEERLHAARKKPTRKVRFFVSAQRVLATTEDRVLRAIRAQMQVNRAARGFSQQDRRTDLGLTIAEWKDGPQEAGSFAEFRNKASDSTGGVLYAPPGQPSFGSSDTTHRGGGN